MTTSDLVAALQPLTAVLTQLGVTYYLGGSLASSTHGIARASLDVDVVAALEAEHVETLLHALGPIYYVPEKRLRDAVMARTSFNLIHLATAFKVDVFVSRRRPFDMIAAARAHPEPIDDAPGAIRFPVASAEDTILAKLEWFRRGGETSERQWSDVIGVLRVSGVDRAYLHQWASTLGVADLLERALADAQ